MEQHPWLEWKTELSDKAETVVIDHKFNEDGTSFDINQQNQVRVIAIFRIGKDLYYTTLKVAKGALEHDSFMKTIIDKRMYRLALNVKARTQSS